MTIELARTLIRLASVTPDDAGCQALIAERLQASGFNITRLPFADVDNLWVTHGSGDPVFCFLGHTDVVPAGPLEDWDSDPFTATEKNGYLYGRGAADMKGSVAAMVVAMERFASLHREHTGTLALLLTSDEEGDAVNGTTKVVEQLSAEGVHISWCLVGEPSSRQRLGDVVKIGRRGSLGAKLRVNGVQGHVAYPELARNPIHALAPALAELCATQWDQGNAYYPPTSFQVSNIHAGTGTVNVIPAALEVLFNFRFSTESSAEELQQRTQAILDRHAIDYDIEWRTSGLPFLTQSGRLIEAAQKAISETSGQAPELSTAGGTSDGRFVAPTGAEVLELGPVNSSIHKANECVSMADLEQLTDMYERILCELLLN